MFRGNDKMNFPLKKLFDVKNLRGLIVQHLSWAVCVFVGMWVCWYVCLLVCGFVGMWVHSIVATPFNLQH